MDPNKTGLATSEGKMHAAVVAIGSLLAILMPILTGLHETFPDNPWIGFAFTVLGAIVALMAAKHYGEQRTDLKQTALVAAAQTAIAIETGKSVSLPK